MKCNSGIEYLGENLNLVDSNFNRNFNSFKNSVDQSYSWRIKVKDKTLKDLPFVFHVHKTTPLFS